MNQFKTLITSSIIAMSMSAATQTHAATFEFLFDGNFGLTAQPPVAPFLGSGTLSFEGDATVGDTLISDLADLAINFTLGGIAFTEDDIDSDTTQVSLRVTGTGNNLFAVFASSDFGIGCGSGALDFNDGTNCLTTAPFEENAGLYIAFDNSGTPTPLAAGSYQGTLVAPAAVPLPAGLPLLLGGLGLMGLVRQRKARV